MQIPSTAIVFVVLLVLIAGCTGPNGQTEVEEEVISPPDTTAPDTTAQVGPTPQLTADPAPPPGTVEVRADIQACDANASPIRCTVTVRSVLRYGPTTPPLAPGERTVVLQAGALDGRTVETLLALEAPVLRLSAPGEERMNREKRTDKAPWTVVRIVDGS